MSFMKLKSFPVAQLLFYFLLNTFFLMSKFSLGFNTIRNHAITLNYGPTYCISTSVPTHFKTKFQFNIIMFPRNSNAIVTLNLLEPAVHSNSAI